ncbi:MAG TPA: RNA polymerase sigma factor [Actinomycetota bacterium]
MAETEVDPSHAAMQEMARVFRESGPGLWRAVYVFTGGRRSVADDAVAEAFARAIHHRDRIRDPIRWLFRTAFRIAASELARDRRFEGERDASVEPPGEEEVDVMRALRQLPRNQRAAVYLVHALGYPAAEAGRLMGIAPATVRVHLHRGRRRLSELLVDREEGSGA